GQDLRRGAGRCAPQGQTLAQRQCRSRQRTGHRVMMPRNPFDVMSEAMIVLILAVIVFGLALLLTPVFLLAVPAWVGFRLWRQSPYRAERAARRQTMALWRHARRGRVRLSEAEIEAALASRFPPDAPESLRVQLVEIGKEIGRAHV